MRTTLSSLSKVALIAAGFCTLAIPLDSEARVRIRSRSHSSTDAEQTQQPAQPTQQQLAEQAAARERQQEANAQAQEKRLAEIRQRQAKNDEVFKEMREKRMTAQLANREKIAATRAQAKASVKEDAPAVAAAPKPVSTPTKMTSYRDANGVMHFTDGTDTSTQARQRTR
jgi:hypothetical protein